MYIITVANSKGGTSKSTLVAHLSVEAERQGVQQVAVLILTHKGLLPIGGM